MVKQLLLLAFLTVVFCPVSKAQEFYTQIGTDPALKELLVAKAFPIGVNSTGGVLGSKIDVANERVEVGPYGHREFEKAIKIHTVCNSVIPRSYFPKWTRWYQEDGNTQIFRLFKDEHNVRNTRLGAARSETFGPVNFKYGDGWHKWEGRYTIVKLHPCMIFQSKNAGNAWSVCLRLHANGDLELDRRESSNDIILDHNMEGKSFDLKVMDDGLNYKVWYNGVLKATGKYSRPTASTTFRWGMYHETRNGRYMQHDAMILVSGATVRTNVEPDEPYEPYSVPVKTKGTISDKSDVSNTPAGTSSVSSPLTDKTWTWQTLDCQGKPTGRHETAFVEVDGLFYLIGGREANGKIDRFNPKTLTWDTMKAQSPLIHHFQPVVLDGKIWMVGAMTDFYPTEPPMKHVKIYDPRADVWTEGPEIPAQRRRGSAGTVVYNGKIYMVGGITFGHTSGTNAWFDEFDPKTNTWKQLPDAPHIRDHFHAVVLSDKLYCIGGRNTSYRNPANPGNRAAFFGAVIRQIDVYDFKTGTWSVLDGDSGLPQGSAAGGTAVLGDCIVYFGGENDKEALSGCWAFDPKTKTWTQLASLNQGRHGSQAIVFENRIYIAAGSPQRGGGRVDSIEMFSSSAAPKK